MIVLLFVLLFVFCALGFEIWAAMGLSAIVYLLLRGDVPLNIMAQSMVAGVDIVTLVAIPFFMLAGELMNESGITERLVRFAQYFVGRIRGGLAYVTVIVNVIMAGVSGSAVADASAVSSVLLPAMARDGYDRRFAAAINASAAVIGPIIPPSIPMVFIAVISDLSIGRLFLGGVVPGLLMGIFLAVTIYLYSLRHALPVTEVRGGLSEFIRLLGEAFLALLAPVIILAGVVFGVVTIVEVAFLAVLYVLLVGMLAYRTIRFRALPGIVSRAAATSVTILAIFASVGAYSWIIANEQLGPQVARAIQSLGLGWVGFLLVANLFFLFLGCIMDAVPAMLIFFPVLLPVAKGLGIDPIHFGVVVVLNLMIGLLTPPVGALLFLEAKLADVSFEELVRAVWPYLAALLCVLALITYVPPLVTFVPNWVFR
ncbi:MAG: dicarboxylate transporter, DctM subunit [candidate division NC10 bacterium]|nr:dicarboxylate transporter, DctM subunit [candidate division NC10 bacterium]